MPKSAAARHAMQKEDAIDRARCEAKRPRFAFWQDHELVQRTWEDDDYDEQEATGLKYGVGFVYYDSLNNSYKKSIQHRDAASSAILREAGLPPLEEHDILSIGSAVSSESSSGAKDGDYRPRQEAAAAGSAVDNSDDDDDDDDDAGFKRKPTKKQQAARNKRRKAATQKEAAAAAAAAAPVSKSGSGSSSHNSKAKAAPSAKPTASKKHAAAAARADDADDGDGKEDAEEGEAADDDEDEGNDDDDDDSASKAPTAKQIRVAKQHELVLDTVELYTEIKTMKRKSETDAASLKKTLSDMGAGSLLKTVRHNPHKHKGMFAVYEAIVANRKFKAGEKDLGDWDKKMWKTKYDDLKKKYNAECKAAVATGNEDRRPWPLFGRAKLALGVGEEGKRKPLDEESDAAALARLGGSTDDGDNVEDDTSDSDASDASSADAGDAEPDTAPPSPRGGAGEGGKRGKATKPSNDEHKKRPAYGERRNKKYTAGRSSLVNKLSAKADSIAERLEEKSNERMMSGMKYFGSILSDILGSKAAAASAATLPHAPRAGPHGAVPPPLEGYGYGYGRYSGMPFGGDPGPFRGPFAFPPFAASMMPDPRRFGGYPPGFGQYEHERGPSGVNKGSDRLNAVRSGVAGASSAGISHFNDPNGAYFREGQPEEQWGGEGDDDNRLSASRPSIASHRGSPGGESSRRSQTFNAAASVSYTADSAAESAVEDDSNTATGAAMTGAHVEAVEGPIDLLDMDTTGGLGVAAASTAAEAAPAAAEGAVSGRPSASSSFATLAAHRSSSAPAPVPAPAPVHASKRPGSLLLRDRRSSRSRNRNTGPGRGHGSSDGDSRRDDADPYRSMYPPSVHPAMVYASNAAMMHYAAFGMPVPPGYGYGMHGPGAMMFDSSAYASRDRNPFHGVDRYGRGGGFGGALDPRNLNGDLDEHAASLGRLGNSSRATRTERLLQSRNLNDPPRNAPSLPGLGLLSASKTASSSRPPGAGASPMATDGSAGGAE